MIARMRFHELMATLLFVIAPIGFRVLSMLIPFLAIVAGGNIVALTVALVLLRQAPKHGRPYLIAAGFIVGQAVTFDRLGRFPAWTPIFASVSDLNVPLLLLATALVSVLLTWHGWVAGARPHSSSALAI
jgi:hypothetical protein